MKIEVSNIEQFKVFFDTVYDVASESVELKFYMDRMTCAVLDRSKARFFYVEYEMKFFDLYDVDEVTSICVSIEDMFKLLKLSNKSDVLTLSFTESSMCAELESNGNKRIFEFTLPYDYVTSPTLPNVELPVQFECGVKDMKQSVKDIGLIGTDIFQFVISKDKITLMCDTREMTSEFSSVSYAQVIDSDIDVDDILTVRFNIDYIAQMLKFDKINKVVHISLADNALIYNFEDEIMGVKVHGMIAPRMEVEVEDY